MSMKPGMYRDWWNDWDHQRPSRLLDQHFGLGLRRDDLLSSLSTVPRAASPLLRDSSRSTISPLSPQMSMVPLMFRDWWEDWDRERPSRLLDQHFGLGLRRDELLSSLSAASPMLRNSYFRPWRAAALARQESSSTINFTKDKFEVILDVQQFSPEEITVKTVENTIIVEGKHEEKQDEHGFISRQFTRRYVLPQGYDAADVISSLSSDGVLTIAAPKKQLPNNAERVVPIAKTGPAKKETPVNVNVTQDPQPTVTSP